MVARTRSTLPTLLSSTILVSHSEEWSLAIRRKGMSLLIHEAKHFILGEHRWQELIREFRLLDNRRGPHNNRNIHQHRRYQQLINLLSIEELKKVSPLIFDSFSLSILQESRRRRRVQNDKKIQEQNQLSENSNCYHHSLLLSNNNNNNSTSSSSSSSSVNSSSSSSISSFMNSEAAAITAPSSIAVSIAVPTTNSVNSNDEAKTTTTTTTTKTTMTETIDWDNYPLISDKRPSSKRVRLDCFHAAPLKISFHKQEENTIFRYTKFWREEDFKCGTDFPPSIAEEREDYKRRLECVNA